MTPSKLVAELAEIHLPSVFNPYSDFCETYDRSDAAQLRRQNLEAFLEAALSSDTHTIWIARDLGYRGGRRTGVPLTDEVHLDLVGQLFGGIELSRATRGAIMAEQTASVVWKVLARIGQPVVLWNVFPFHPHGVGDQFTNRCHTAAERRIAAPLLKNLIAMFRPQQVVAIGRDAHVALRGLDIPAATVRHPSYGGRNEFVAGLCAIYGVRSAGLLPNSAVPMG